MQQNPPTDGLHGEGPNSTQEHQLGSNCQVAPKNESLPESHLQMASEQVPGHRQAHNGLPVNGDKDHIPVTGTAVDRVDPFPRAVESEPVFAFGSSECDQFPNEDEIYERKKPVAVPFPELRSKIAVVKIVCGSQHTLVLSEIGSVYSFGNSDDGCLGRDSSTPSSFPGRVDLPVAVDLISAGDTHSVAANSATGRMYVWGAVKSSLKGKLFKHEFPEEKNFYFLNRGIQDLKSGDNHIVLLSHSRAYTWGDNDTGALGTVFRGELEEKKIFEPNAVGLKAIVRIFVGKNASFFETKKRQIYGCGLNNYGQLGAAPKSDEERWTKPTLIEQLDGSEIAEIVGGEHHTLVLKKDGTVLGAGRNDDGQIGEAVDEPEDDENEVCDINGNCTSKTAEAKGTFRAIKGLSGIGRVWASNHYNYAQEGTDGPFHSWGFGMSYVLGNGKEDSVYEPWRINDDKFWGGNRPTVLSLGHSHVVFTSGSVGSKERLSEVVLAAKKRRRKGSSEATSVDRNSKRRG